MEFINLAWTTFQEYNQTGLEGLITYPGNTWAGFMPLMLFALLMITTMAIYNSQKRLTGRGDFASSYAVGSFFVAVIAFILTLIPGAINGMTLSVCVVNSIIAVIILFLTRDTY